MLRSLSFRARTGDHSVTVVDGGVSLHGEVEWIVHGDAAHVSLVREAVGAVAHDVAPGVLILRFGNAVGRFAVSGLGCIHVRCGKWGNDTFEAMLDELTAIAAELPFTADQRASLPHDRALADQPPILMHAFLYLRSIVLREDRPGSLQFAFERILRDPHQRFAAERVRVGLEAASRADTRTLAHLVTATEPLVRTSGTKAGAARLAQALRGHLPLTINAPNPTRTYDTAENRFAKALLQQVTAIIERVEYLSRGRTSAFWRGIHADCAAVRAIVSPIVRHPLWTAVGPMAHVPIGSSVLQRRRGYRAILRHHLALRAAARLPIDERELEELLGAKDVATLYELWTFFKVVSAVERLLGAPDHVDRPEPTPLQLGIPWSFRASWRRPAVSIFYNLSFNLARVSELAGYVGERLAQHDLFLRVLDPSHPRARHRHDVVPLTELRAADGRARIAERLRPDSDRARTLARIDEIGLLAQVAAMGQRELFYVVLEESEGKNGLAEVVRLFNRINSAGKRVEAEERAFAALTALWPGTGLWMDQLFRAIHDAPATSALKRRDKVLERKRERSFGFKLFFRVMLQACAYHLGYSVGASSFSFDLAARPDFQQRLGEERAAVELIAEHARGAILAIHGALTALGCDALQLLPETESFLPLVQLLLRFPGLAESEPHRATVQLLVLRLQLAELTTRALIELVKLVNSHFDIDACVAALLAELPAPGRSLERRLQDANTLQDRHLLLLYWLLRRRGARDFSYENLAPARRDALYADGRERALCGEVCPEKQHIVPFAHLKKLFALGSGRRPSFHESNNIGNLTFISQDLNGYTLGLGDAPIRLEHDDEENLRAHLLSGARDADVRALYQDAFATQRGFERFCRARRRLIGEAFVAWHAELALRVPTGVPVRSRAPLLADTPESRVQSFGFGPALEDCLLELLAKGKAKQHSSGALVLEAGEVVGKLRITAEEIVLSNPGKAHHPIAERVRAELPQVEHEEERIVFRRALGDERVRALLGAMEEMAAVMRRRAAGAVPGERTRVAG